jgi:hypothetical protein
MKTYEIKFTVKCTDEFYNDEAIELKNQILSGEFQRTLKSEGINSVKATFTDIKS